jgi:hypothetical protein
VKPAAWKQQCIQKQQTGVLLVWEWEIERPGVQRSVSAAGHWSKQDKAAIAWCEHSQLSQQLGRTGVSGGVFSPLDGTARCTMVGGQLRMGQHGCSEQVAAEIRAKGIRLLEEQTL